MWRYYTILLAILGLLQYRLWYGNNNLNEYKASKIQIQKELVNNKTLQNRNQILRAEITDLKTGSDALEEHARNQLGMIKKDEVFYRVVTKDQMRPH